LGEGVPIFFMGLEPEPLGERELCLFGEFVPNLLGEREFSLLGEAELSFLGEESLGDVCTLGEWCPLRETEPGLAFRDRPLSGVSESEVALRSLALTLLENLPLSFLTAVAMLACLSSLLLGEQSRDPSITLLRGLCFLGERCPTLAARSNCSKMFLLLPPGVEEPEEAGEFGASFFPFFFFSFSILPS
jgi:hypothetical protein